jgi:hypothetical protein
VRLRTFVTSAHAPARPAQTAKPNDSFRRYCGSAYRFSYETSEERKQWLTPYLHFYNYHRAHSAAAYNAPISRLDRNNVLRRNS